eukprot:12409283-Karenia_brevis.AAC.1
MTRASIIPVGMDNTTGEPSINHRHKSRHPSINSLANTGPRQGVESVIAVKGDHGTRGVLLRQQ